MFNARSRQNASVFILAAQRDDPATDEADLWSAYREYVDQRQSAFPPAAYALATSDW